MFFCYASQGLSRQPLKGRCCIAQAEWHPFPMIQAKITCKSTFSVSCFRKGTCQKAEPRSSVVNNLPSQNFERLSSLCVIGQASLMVHAFRVAKFATESQLSSFVFGHDDLTSQSDFEGSIISYSSSISIFARHASDLSDVIRLALSLWRMAPSYYSIACSTKLQQPISALCLEKNICVLI